MARMSDATMWIQSRYTREQFIREVAKDLFVKWCVEGDMDWDEEATYAIQAASQLADALKIDRE